MILMIAAFTMDDGCDLSAVFALLQLLEQLTGAPDVPGQREAAIQLRHGPVHVHHDDPVTSTRPFPSTRADP